MEMKQHYTTALTLRVLRKIFPERTALNYSHLTWLKKRQLIIPSGANKVRRNRGRDYSLVDIVLVAILIDVKQDGLDMCILRREIKRAQKLSIERLFDASLMVQCRNWRLTYDPYDMVMRVFKAIGELDNELA